MSAVEGTFTLNDNTEFLQKAFKIIMEEGVQNATDRNQKVCEWLEPEELKKVLDFNLRNNGESQDVLLGYCRDIIRLSVKTGHPHFFNQLFSGLDRYALTGRIMTETLNTSQYTYEVAPVFVLMEDEVLRTMRSFIGWNTGDGIFCPADDHDVLGSWSVSTYPVQGSSIDYSDMISAGGLALITVSIS